jgi:1-acyl-sn-glycerol-3-phosphate acyltransferase
MLALKAGVPVVPVVVMGTDRIMEKGSLRVGRAAVEVRIGRPIETRGRGATARDRLMADVRRAMIDLGARACEDAAA